MNALSGLVRRASLPGRSLRAPRHRASRKVRVVAALALVGGLPVLLDHVSAAILPPAAPVANAVLPSSTQFDITGFLQDAKLDQACVTAAGASVDAQGFLQAAHCGGTMQLNGHTIVVPAETIVILPAGA